MPELALYVGGFSLYLFFWQKTEHKVFDILAAIYLVLMVGMGILGFLQATGRLPAA